MEGMPLARYIRGLDEHTAVELAHSLLSAERGRLQLPLDAVSWSFRVKAQDGGVDGRTRFPLDAVSTFPLGSQIWQVKSATTAPRATKEFSKKKDGTEKALVELLRTNDWGYVLFWTNDPPDHERNAVKADFDQALDAISTTIPRSYIFLDEIVDLARRNPRAVLPVLGLPGIGGLAVDEWGSQFNGPFVEDASRSDALERIRSHLTSPHLGRAVLRLYGDVGVGKSRLAFEAMADEGLRRRGLVVIGRDGRDLATYVASDPEASLILVVDDADEDDVRSIIPAATAAGGRLRVLTIENRIGREAADDRNVEVAPLTLEATKEIVRGSINDELLIDPISRLAAGYPKLASELAIAIREPLAGHELAALARRREIASVLARMVPDPSIRRSLAAIAPFRRVGVDDDARDELAEICRGLGLDVLATIVAIDSQVGRFVARSRQHRRITPGLLAIWLVDDAVEQFGDRLVDTIAAASSPLIQAFVDRIESATGSTAAGRLLEALIARPRFKIESLRDLASRSGSLFEWQTASERGRLFGATAVVYPALAISTIHPLVVAATDAERQAVATEHHLISALEELVWHEETFERAAECLVLLGISEDGDDRHWSARSVFNQVFQLHLSGTVVPYSRRLGLADRIVADGNREQMRLLIAALEGAFEVHFTRNDSRRGRLTGRDDWTPTREEAAEVRERSWRLLTSIAVGSPELRDDVGKSVWRSIRGAFDQGLGPTVDETVRGVDWSARTRAQIAHELRLAVRYATMEAPQREAMASLADHLEGGDFRARLALVLASEPWELLSTDEAGLQRTPDVIVALVAEMQADPDRLSDALNETASGRPLTTRLIFHEFGRTAADATAYAAVRGAGSESAAPIGFIAGRAAAGDDQWVDAEIGTWTGQADLAARLPEMVRLLPPTDARATLAIEAVDSGFGTAEELSSVLFGAWAQRLAAPVLTRLLRSLQSGSDYVVENALGILGQWMDIPEQEPTTELAEVGLALAIRSLEPPSDYSAMTSLVRVLALRRLPVATADLTALGLMVLRRGSEPDENDLKLLDLALASAGDSFVATIVNALVDASESSDPPTWLYAVDDAHLLSHLAAAGKKDEILAAISASAPTHLDRLFDHTAVVSDAGGLDAMFEALLVGHADDEDVRDAAANAFVMDRTAFRGPYYAHLEDRMQEATRLAREHPDERVRAWAAWVSGRLSERIDEFRRREDPESEEDGF